MLHETEMLQYVYKTTDMGCYGIRSVLDHVQSASLKDELNAQHNEYRKLRRRARDLLKSRNELPAGAGRAAKISASLMSAGKIMADRTDSKIAEMTIQGNQMGINKTTKHLNHYSGKDGAVRALAEKLLSTEQANAEQLMGFL